MKRKSTIIMIVVLLLAAGCGVGTGTVPGADGAIGVDVVPTMPGMSSGVTEAGNPGDEVENPKGMYINSEFGVKIAYPITWSVTEHGFVEAVFVSTAEDQIVASFMRLANGDTFESFLEDVRGGEDGMVESPNDGFDRGLCVEDSGEGDVEAVECYFFRADAKGDFVVALNGAAEGGMGALEPSVTVKDSVAKDAGLKVMSATSEDNVKHLPKLPPPAKLKPFLRVTL